MDNRIKQIISQIKSEETSEQEAIRVEKQLEKLWLLGQQYKQGQEPPFDTEKNLAQLKARMHQASPSYTPPAPLWIKIAAALLFVLLGTWVANTYFFSSQPFQSFHNQNMEAQLISLPDGSTVNVHPGAKILYPRRFSNAAQREVQLFGTAYFDVRAANRPFTIQTENTQVKVLGTAFLLRAEPGHQETSVEVKEGAVYFLDKESQQEIMIEAQQTGIQLSGGIIFQEPTQVKEPLMVNLRNQPLARLFAQLERHHDWEFDLQEDIRQCRLTGTFSISNPEKVLRQIDSFSSYQVVALAEGKYRISGTCQ